LSRYEAGGKKADNASITIWMKEGAYPKKARGGKMEDCGIARDQKEP